MSLSAYMLDVVVISGIWRETIGVNLPLDLHQGAVRGHENCPWQRAHGGPAGAVVETP